MRRQSSLLIVTLLFTMPFLNAFAFTNGQSASTVIGQPDFTTITPGSGNNKLNFPHSVAFDSAGNLLVVDSENHRVLRFPTPLTTGSVADIVIGQPDFTTITPGSGNNKLNFPSDVIIDSVGNLLVLDGENNRVLKFNAPLTTGMAASEVIGQPDFTTITPDTSNDGLNLPDGMTLDSAGNLLIADSFNNRVLRFPTPLTTGSVADLVIGQTDFVVTVSGLSNDKLSHPHSVTLDSAGNLLVSDQFNNRVLKFNAPLTTGMAASEVIGQPDFTTNAPGSGNNKVDSLTDIVLDSAGNLLVSDGNNNRVLKFNAPLTTGMAASEVIGQPDFTTNAPGSGNNKIGGYSEGIALDLAGNLLVTDEQNHRILKFEAQSVASQSISQTTGQLTIQGTCGIGPLTPLNYGTLTPSQPSAEQTLTITNTGSVPGQLFVQGSDWESAPFVPQIPVGNTYFGIASTPMPGPGPISAAPPIAGEAPLGHAYQPVTFSGAFFVGPNNTFWQVVANLLNPSFTGVLTQEYNFTASC